MVASKDSDLPVFVAWLDFLEWLLPTTAKLPKHVRFTFVNRIDNQVIGPDRQRLGRVPRTGPHVNCEPRARRLSSSIRTTRLGRLTPHFQRTRLISSTLAPAAKLRTSNPV